MGASGSASGSASPASRRRSFRPRRGDRTARPKEAAARRVAARGRTVGFRRRWRTSTQPLIDLVGHTPIVRLDRISGGRARDDPRQARVHEPGRLEQGPDRARDDRGGRARREAQAGRHDRRADLGQHRRRARDRGRAQGLPLHLRDAGQDEPGEDLDAARLRRRGRDHADRRRARLARVVLLGLVAARGGDPGRVQARPVLEHVEPRGALPHDRAGDPRADRRRARRDRHLGRHRRHDQRRRALLQGARARRADRRRRPRGLRLHGEERVRPASRTSSKGSARTRGRRRWTRRSSTSGFASPTATRSSPRGGSRARKGCSSAARPARRSPARSSTPRSSGPSRGC